MKINWKPLKNAVWEVFLWFAVGSVILALILFAS
jgi:hypothetical protein